MVWYLVKHMDNLIFTKFFTFVAAVEIEPGAPWILE
jgi:hypothetical protein